MKILCTSIWVIFFVVHILPADAQKAKSVAIIELKLRAPFDMPAIKVPDFRKFSRISITDFGAVTGKVQEREHIHENVVSFSSTNGFTAK